MDKLDYKIKRISDKRDAAKKKRQKIREQYTKTSSRILGASKDIDLSVAQSVPKEIIQYAVQSEKLYTFKEREDILTDYIELCDSMLELLQEPSNKVRNTRKISDKDIRRIKELKKRGYSYSEISCDTGWSKGTISNVVNGKYDD